MTKKKLRADEALHTHDEGVDKSKRMPKINKYGFLHVDKDLAKHLGVKFGKDKSDVPVSVERIERGFIVRLKV